MWRPIKGRSKRTSSAPDRSCTRIKRLGLLQGRASQVPGAFPAFPMPISARAAGRRSFGLPLPDAASDRFFVRRGLLRRREVLDWLIVLAIHAATCVGSAGLAAAIAATTRARAGCRRTTSDLRTGKSAREWLHQKRLTKIVEEHALIASRSIHGTSDRPEIKGRRRLWLDSSSKRPQQVAKHCLSPLLLNRQEADAVQSRQWEWCGSQFCALQVGRYLRWPSTAVRST